MKRSGETVSRIITLLLEYPFDWIPIRGKTPTKGWPTEDYSRFNFAEWLSSAGNVGFRLRPCDLVIDVDPRNIADGDDPLHRLRLAVAADLRSAPATITGSGGLHLFFTKPEGRRIVKTLPDYLGLEFYTAVHFMVAPGSIHPDTGKPYRAKGDFLNIPPAPASLLDMLDRPKAERTGDPGVLEEGELAALLATLNARQYGQGYYSEWIALAAAATTPPAVIALRSGWSGAPAIPITKTLKRKSWRKRPGIPSRRERGAAQATGHCSIWSERWAELTLWGQ